jgi:putative MFS transporter
MRAEGLRPSSVKTTPSTEAAPESIWAGENRDFDRRSLPDFHFVHNEDQFMSDIPSGVATRSSVTARLERLPFTRYQKTLVLIIATAYAFDGVELAVLTYTLAPLKAAFALTPVQVGFLASSTFVGMAVGALCAGVISDRFGRRSVISSSMYVWGVASLLTALAWNFESLAGFRFLTGLGMGAELPVAFAMLSEILPRARRGRVLGITNLAVTGGYLLCGGAAFVFLSTTGWRGIFVFMGLLAIFGVIVRRSMPESPRWLESRGRFADADITLAAIEEQVERASGAPLPAPAPEPPPNRETGREDSPLRTLLSRPHRRRTLLAWAVWFLNIMAFYGITTWTAALLVERGVSVLGSIVLVVLMYLWQIPGTLIASYLMDKIGRKPVYVAALVLYALSAVLYVSASSSTAWVLVFGSMLQFFSAWNTAANYTYTPELFPTRARATGTGTASSWGRAGAIIGPLLVPLIVSVGGYVTAFTFLAVLLVLAAILLLIFGPETKGRQLEEISN